jgi:hypothetical protein
VLEALAVEIGAVARGWELTKLVELGFGIAILNGCCRIPRRLAARPLRELPPVCYVVFTRPRPRVDAVALVEELVAKGDAWRQPNEAP